MLEIEAGIGSEDNTVDASAKSSFRSFVASCGQTLRPRPSSNNGSAAGRATRPVGSGNTPFESLDQWFETLPFPLASILRAWQATPSQDFKTKYEHLLHFFEATAEFFGVILLSAFSSNEAVFQSHKREARRDDAKAEIEFSTFDVWDVEASGGIFRQTDTGIAFRRWKKSDDAKNDKALCADMFSDSSLSLPRGTQPERVGGYLLPIRTRCETTGVVTGAWSDQEEARLRNQQLLGEVQKLSETIADLWMETRLRSRSTHSRTSRSLRE